MGIPTTDPIGHGILLATHDGQNGCIAMFSLFVGRDQIP